MSWFHRTRHNAALAEEMLEELPPRSTLLPPPPPGIGLDDAPRTMRVPVRSETALAVSHAVIDEIDGNYDDFTWEEEEDERPTMRRHACRPAAPTMPCRIA
jgi:hypothetical protein